MTADAEDTAGAASDRNAPLRILFATDFSRWASEAERYACSLASSWNASLTVMSVLEFPPGMNPEYPVNQLYLSELMKQTTADLVDFKTRAAERGLAVETRVTTGIPSEEVVRAAQRDDVDLIVVGTRGKSGLEHVVLGSTAERIIRMAPSPVLAVRGSGAPPPAEPVSFHRILVPVDFSDCSLNALEYAALVARRTKASLRVLHVLEPVCYGLDFTLSHASQREAARARMTERLADLVAALQGGGVTAEQELRGGLPSDSILEAAEGAKADLIVMGTHGRRGLSHAFWGSVAESVLRKSARPVLAVRSPQFHPGHRRILSGAARSGTSP